MKILSHRGYWLEPAEKNTQKAFERSFSLNFGTETDVRDYGGKLVISHDIADKHAMPLEFFFEIYKKFNSNLPLALNIKADGLQYELKKLLSLFQIENYFVFDMAVPDGLLYARDQITLFTRHSEYEINPSYYDLANGVWLDEFNRHWITDETINRHLEQRKSICIVSPELHKRDNSQEWIHYKLLEKKIGKNKMMLCTDVPEQAREFFND